MKEIVFYYDVICPYANLASKLIGDVAKRNHAKLLWRPVLLGGIYKSTKHKDASIPDNKMIKTYSDVKRNVLAKDLAMLYNRYNIPISTFKVPDIRTLNAMRLIASTPDESSELRTRLTHCLFDAIWKEQKDVSDLKILQNIANSVNWEIDVRDLVDDKSNPTRQILIDNTEEAVQRGAFGVPSIWVNNKLYFGNDRLFFVEHELGNKTAVPHCILTKPIPEAPRKRKLTMFVDFASPWTYIGFKMIPDLVCRMKKGGVHVEVEYVPIVLGALFKTIGTPVVPVQAMGDNKRNYQFRDMDDWIKYLKLKFQMSSYFPLRTILPLRMALVNPEYKMMEALFDAGWKDDKNISDEKVIKEVLTSAGYDFQSLYEKSNEQPIKDQLRANLQRALDNGICGLPSFQVDDGPAVFGQDRLNVVQDMLMGWQFDLDKFVSRHSKL